MGLWPVGVCTGILPGFLTLGGQDVRRTIVRPEA